SADARLRLLSMYRLPLQCSAGPASTSAAILGRLGRKAMRATVSATAGVMHNKQYSLVVAKSGRTISSTTGLLLASRGISIGWQTTITQVMRCLSQASGISKYPRTTDG